MTAGALSAPTPESKAWAGDPPNARAREARLKDVFAVGIKFPRAEKAEVMASVQARRVMYCSK